MATVDTHPPASSAVQDYAKAIYALERRGERPVTNNALAERLGVSPPRRRAWSSGSTRSGW